MRKFSIAVVAATLPLMALTGCTGSVPKSDVETTIADKLEEQTGQRPETVECPEDLEAKEGATMRCELRDSGIKLGVKVNVTEVDGDKAKFDIEVDDAAETIDETQ